MKSAMKTNETKYCIEEYVVKSTWSNFISELNSNVLVLYKFLHIWPHIFSLSTSGHKCVSKQPRFDDILPPARLQLPWSKFSFAVTRSVRLFWSWNNRSCVTIRIPERPAGTRGERIFTPFCHKKKHQKQKLPCLDITLISSNTSHRFALFRYCTLHQYAVCLCSHVLFTPRPLALLMTETCTLARILPDLIFL